MRISSMERLAEGVLIFLFFLFIALPVLLAAKLARLGHIGD